MENSANNLFWYAIVVKDEKHNWINELCLKWDNLPWQVRCKYGWYFKYRAALLQVKYPKYHIEQSWGVKPPDTKTTLKYLKDKIASKKRMVTKIKNALDEYTDKLESTELFGIDGANKAFKNTKEKLRKYEFELIE
ncbi:MAG: hypothetical protein E2604_11075, partial [Flavobacterium sp.]|nr:hypothetical protein [Flavobacterium sp.]